MHIFLKKEPHFSGFSKFNNETLKAKQKVENVSVH